MRPRPLSTVALLALAACAAPGPRERGRVEWLPWEPAAFRRARAEDRLLLVGVEAAWCHWCHVMDDETWGDPEVAALVRDHFVAVRVDADARPDVAERYAAWGWPATAVLTPDARPVLERRGFRPPREMADLLRGLVEDRRAGRPLARPPEPPPPRHEGPLEEVRARVERSLDAYFDPEGLGWGRGIQKYPLSSPVEHAFLRARLRGEGEWIDRALRTLEAEARLLDPVWGGMYQYSERGGWDAPHFEKIAAVQAGALENFVEAYRVTGDGRWLGRARAIESWLTGFLAREGGGFGSSQDADLGRPGEPGAVPGDRYFALDDAGRRALGMPRVDGAVYADYNGMIAAALCRLHEATGAPAPLDAARRAVDRVLAGHAAPGGGLRHGADDGGPVLHLADQVEVGRALLLLHDATPPSAHDSGAARAAPRAAAAALARALLDRFEDPERGGFFAHTADPSATGVFAERRKPFEGNARAARFLLGLWRRTGEERWREAALRALRAFAAPEVLAAQDRFTGDYLLALEEAAAPRILFTVVGGESREARDLWAAALRVYEPLKVMEHETPGGKYGDPGAPAVFVCDDAACSAPIRDPAALDAFSRRRR